MNLLLSSEFAPMLEGLLPKDVEVVWLDPLGNWEGEIHDAEVYLNAGLLKSTILEKVLQAAPALRWQHTLSAGVNHLLNPSHLSRNIILTNGAGIHAIPVAEFTLGLMLDHVKRLHNLHQLQTDHEWDNSWRNGNFLRELSGATVLIIGAGSIGQAIGHRANAFGMRVWGSRKHPEPLPSFEKVVGSSEWYTLLPEADFVVLALPLTPETKEIINADVFKAMNPTAYFINIARGALVEEPALIMALTEGWIAGAGLDTFAVEPLPPESPLWSLPNAFITPHISWSSPNTRQRTAELFLDNLHRFRHGLPLRNVVDRQVGY
ncbi:MAG: D-2-hydroxyacid dehydrogenase [Cyanobacteriota bacterium]|nr:D-2-hydroxyacid dehydrogenase [Cyanobacteriota bacterium]